MRLKKLVDGIAIAVGLVGLLGPAGPTFAAGGGWSHYGPGIAAHESAPEEGSPDDNAEEPAHHDHSGDGDSGDGDTCAVAAGPVAVCVTQPR
jgi:hypothetical protein